MGRCPRGLYLPDLRTWQRLVHARIRHNLQRKIGEKNISRRFFYVNYSTSRFLYKNKSSSKNSSTVIPKPLAIIITVESVTVLLFLFKIHCICPCCMPDCCSNRYCVIFFWVRSCKILVATASLTVIIYSKL